MKKGFRMEEIIFISVLFIMVLTVNCGPMKSKDSVQPKKILGIFGGMGPGATANLYQLIVERTPASTDQEHIPTLIYSLPQVPDRMVSIQNNDLSIISYIVEGVTRLEKGGASFIAIPCNTVHYYFDHMENAVSIPIIHMIRETADEVVKKYPDIKTVGLLATTGTISTGLYEKALSAKGLKVVVPDDDIEKDYVMKAVYGIKSGEENKKCEDLLAAAGDHVEEKGAQVIVLGCTEIPLAFNPARAHVPVINATEVLADRAIAMYFNE
ncbi:aspartate/glutamate racemase family protein [bacterium]